MGGFGSGRTSYKLRAEHCRSLDVNRMNRAGSLAPGSRGSWVWSRDGAEVGRIDYRAEPHRLHLVFRVRQYGGDWEAVTDHVGITYVNCHYGSIRPYFLCPGMGNGRYCGRRVAKLYCGGRYFLCRHCYNIGYTSQLEPQYDRLLRRANKGKRSSAARAKQTSFS